MDNSQEPAGAGEVENNNVEEEENHEEESLSMSLSKASEVSEEIFIPELMEVSPTESSKETEIMKQHQPVIMEKANKEATPPQTQQSYSKLLNRRKSVDPIRFREIKKELFGTEDFSLNVEETQPQQPSAPPPPPPASAMRKEPTTPTGNLKMSLSTKYSVKKRKSFKDTPANEA